MKLLSTAGLAWICASGIACDDRPAVALDPSKFMRFVKHDDRSASLESTVTSYVDAKGRRVDLVGAVHVADSEYFELLNRIFQGYDSVLYELVKPKDAPVVPGAKGDSLVSAFQRGMKDVLGVEFQLDLIDYTAENLVHADLEPDEFFRLQEEKGENLLTLMLHVMLKEAERTADSPEAQAMPMALLLTMMSKDRARGLKMLLGKQFAELERIAAGFETTLAGEESVLLIDRNKAAMRVLEDELDDGKERIAIFYGAAHLPDMERRLVHEFGFEKQDETWITAWNIPAPEKEPDE